MGHYKSNLRDIFFNLFEVLGRDEILGTGPYADMDHDTAVAVLTEVDRLARTKLADSFAEVDRNLPVFDPATRSVTLPEAFKKTFTALMESGSWQLELPAELGGQPTPPSVQWAVNELNVGANPAVYLYSTGPKFALVLWADGTERDKEIAKLMVDRGWAATMVLTEHDAGSDVGAGRTRAIPKADGNWLLGEVHAGIAQMFQVIEYARMMVGTKAIATLSTGYLNALEYAKTRVQGPDLTQAADKAAPRVTITHHPDVRRSLMNQKAFTEGLRALMLYTASIQDRVALGRANGSRDLAAECLNNLLLPIVKGYGSERSWVLLGTESLQTLGGSGFLQEYPIEQYVRDAKIDTLYEGTTAIQGQDLFFRKIVKDEGALLEQGLQSVGEIVATMVTALQSAAPNAPQGDVRNVYKVGLNTTRL